MCAWTMPSCWRRAAGPAESDRTGCCASGRNGTSDSKIFLLLLLLMLGCDEARLVTDMSENDIRCWTSAFVTASLTAHRLARN